MHFLHIAFSDIYCFHSTFPSVNFRLEEILGCIGFTTADDGLAIAPTAVS